MRKKRVLVVEDNELNRELLCQILSQEYDVIEAENGQVALEILKAAYEAGNIDAEPYFKGLIFDADSRIGSLKESAMRLALQPGESLLAAHTFAGELEDFANAMGVELSTKYGDLVDAQGAMMEQVRAAAGL